ncbi:MAG: hypothetical protein ABFD50_07970 [Smithella sp.]
MSPTYEQFKKYIDTLRNHNKLMKELYAIGFQFDKLEDLTHKVEDSILEMVFNKSQKEYLDWWLYDSPNAIEGDLDPSDDTVWIRDRGNPVAVRTTKEIYDFLMTLKGVD